MSFGARVIMLVVGGVVFGGGASASVGNLMGLSSGGMTNAVTAGVVGGLGLAFLLIGVLAREAE